MKAKGIYFATVAAPFLWVGCGDDTTGRVESSQQRSVVAPASITQNDFTLHEDDGGISTLRLDLVNQFTLTRPGFTPLSGNFSNPVQNGNSFTLTLISPEQQDSLILNYITVQSGSFTLLHQIQIRLPELSPLLQLRETEAQFQSPARAPHLSLQASDRHCLRT